MSFVLAEDLHKSYPSGRERLQVLKGLGLEVKAGHMVAITGASGSGKSTLLHLLGGMDLPDRGKVFLDGIDIFSLSRQELARLRNQMIGFVFQFHHLLPEFTALENVMMPYLIRGADWEVAREKARRALDEVSLGDRLHHKSGELSGGEQQRVAIARALVIDPKLVLADEPTGNLDSRTAETIFRLLRQLHAQKRLTSIIATHNEKLAAICDQVYRLEDGRLAQV